MRVYYTARLRTHDMGILQLGFVTFPIHFIPPGAESFLSYGLCKTEKFEEVMPRGANPLHGPSPCLRVPAAWRSGKSLAWVLRGSGGVRASRSRG